MRVKSTLGTLVHGRAITIVLARSRNELSLGGGPLFHAAWSPLIRPVRRRHGRSPEAFPPFRSPRQTSTPLTNTRSTPPPHPLEQIGVDWHRRRRSHQPRESALFYRFRPDSQDRSNPRSRVRSILIRSRRAASGGSPRR